MKNPNRRFPIYLTIQEAELIELLAGSSSFKSHKHCVALHEKVKNHLIYTRASRANEQRYLDSGRREDNHPRDDRVGSEAGREAVSETDREAS